MTTFRCDENGDLWFNDWNRGSDDHARQQMVRQRDYYEASLSDSWRCEKAAECRQALEDYDAYWLEDDEQLRYETEMGQ